MFTHNIVFIGRLSFPNGLASTKRRRYIVDYLNEQNISCKVICLRQKDSKRFNNLQHGFYGSTEYVDFSKLYYSGILGVISYFYSVNKYLQMFRLKDHKNILIFHTNLEIDAIPFFVCAKLLGYKIIFDQVETSNSLNHENKSFISKLYSICNDIVSKWAYKKSNGSFVISDSLWKQNEERYPEIPLCLLPNSTEFFFNKKKQHFSKPVKILYAGTFAVKDGVRYLIDAYKEVLLIYPSTELILLGKGNDIDMKMVFESIKNIETIKYLGYVTDQELIEIILSADILTMTRTNSEFANFGFPFKLSEYLSSGNPVLATKVSDVEKYLTHDLNAILAEPENVESIYNGLIYLLEDEERAIQIGYKGYLVAKEEFSKERIGKIFVDFMKIIS